MSQFRQIEILLRLRKASNDDVASFNRSTDTFNSVYINRNATHADHYFDLCCRWHWFHFFFPILNWVLLTCWMHECHFIDVHIKLTFGHRAYARALTFKCYTSTQHTRMCHQNNWIDAKIRKIFDSRAIYSYWKKSSKKPMKNYDRTLSFSLSANETKKIGCGRLTEIDM